MAGHGAWKRADATVLAGRMRRIVADPDAALRTWLERKPATAAYLHPVVPEASRAQRLAAGDLLAGAFKPHKSVAARQENLPPRWHAGPGSGRTEEMYRHSLRWLEPLVAVAHVDADDHAWRAATDVVTSWINENSTPPGRSDGAWHDHAVSIRTRMLCWFFELYRRRPGSDHGVIKLLVAGIHQHGLYLADPSTYSARSNHALEANGALLAIRAALPELRRAAVWESLAHERLERYVAEAFTADGFSKEQSPRYHFFILRRLAAVVGFLGAADRPAPASVVECVHRATAVWPWLMRDDGSAPRVGDSRERRFPQWRGALVEAMGRDLPPPAPSPMPNPRSDDAAAMLVSFDAGYAVLRGNHPAAPAAAPDATPGAAPDAAPDADDTHVLFKCNYFRYPHFHHDGLSFVFYALGREWLIDPGHHSYEYDSWERQYLCSSSAHNVVEIGGHFGVHPVEFVDMARTAEGDRVTVRHHLEHAVHTRTLEHRPLRRLHIVDEVEVTDGGVHDIRQLFHVHPDCAVERDAKGGLELTAPRGDRCLITQRAQGTWRVARGQREPEPLGWYSPQFMELEPIETWCYEARSSGSVRFETIIEVVPTAPEAASTAP
jgi:hypothetical protein